MSTLKRIDSFYINYADSFARTNLKIVEPFVHANGTPAKKGQGEKRLYVGHDEGPIDKFFEFDQDPKFFIMKEDLVAYLDEAKSELKDPHFDFGGSDAVRAKVVSDYEAKLASLTDEKLFFEFKKTYDKQKRYYLVLKPGTTNRDNYNYIRDIALPRVTRLLFVKLHDDASNKFYIYIKPVILPLNSKPEETLAPDTISIQKATPKSTRKSRDPQKQAKFRAAVLDLYPHCVITNVTDPDLLDACHLKDWSECEPQEEYDPFNGLSMTPTLHRLFDLGDMTIKDDGEVIFSEFLRNMDKVRLNLNNKTFRIALRRENKPYLKWHRENVFRTLSTQALNI